MGSLWSGIWDEVYFAYQRRADKVKADKEGLVVADSTRIDGNTEIHPGQAGEQVRYAGEVTTTLIPAGKATDTYYDYESRNYVNDINREHVQVLSAYDETGTTREIYTYGNERLTFSDGTDTFTYAYTGLQSVSALTDKNGDVVSNYTYAEDDPVNYVDPSGHRVMTAMMTDGFLRKDRSLKEAMSDSDTVVIVRLKDEF